MWIEETELKNINEKRRQQGRRDLTRSEAQAAIATCNYPGFDWTAFLITFAVTGAFAETRPIGTIIEEASPVERNTFTTYTSDYTVTPDSSPSVDSSPAIGGAE